MIYAVTRLRISDEFGTTYALDPNAEAVVHNPESDALFSIEIPEAEVPDRLAFGTEERVTAWCIKRNATGRVHRTERGQRRGMLKLDSRNTPIIPDETGEETRRLFLERPKETS